MKLVVLFLVAVCCCTLVLAEANKTLHCKKLRQVLRELAEVREILPNGTMLNSPPQDVEACCYLPALQCFHANLMVHFNGTIKMQRKLTRSLNNTLTKQGVEYCPLENNTTTTCHVCNSQPKVYVKEFFDRLQSLIQLAIIRLGSK